MSSLIQDEIALRIGLATKVLEGVSNRQMLELLISIMGEPITQAKLDKLRAKKVRLEGETLFRHVCPQRFEQAFALLKGRGVQQYLNPRPTFQPGTFCEIHGTLLVACASDSGEMINGQFSQSLRFLIYQVSPEHCRLIDIREPAKRMKRAQADQARASLIRDCALLYVTSISARAAAKVVKLGIHPIKLDSADHAQTALSKLQTVLAKTNPPPWLVKAMDKPTVAAACNRETLA